MCSRNQKLAAKLMRHIARRAPIPPGKVRQGKERALREFGCPERRGAMAVQSGAQSLQAALAAQHGSVPMHAPPQDQAVSDHGTHEGLFAPRAHHLRRGACAQTASASLPCLCPRAASALYDQRGRAVLASSKAQGPSTA